MTILGEISMASANDLPKYLKLKNAIIERINRGVYKPGDKLPTENELASEFDISRHTVRKAMDILLNEGLVSRKAGLGTFLNKSSKKETKLIGFISLNVHDYIFSDIFNGIETVLHDRGYQILLSSSQSDQEREKTILEELLKKNVDGLIIEPAHSAISYPNIGILERFVNSDIPVVILDSKFDNKNFHYVGLDDVNGGYLATKALIDLGHKNIAMIYSKVHLPLIDRFKGYKKALEEEGLPIYLDHVKECSHTELEDVTEFENQLKNAVTEIMGCASPPSAIFCVNDQFAVRVKSILEKMGYQVPADVSLIGYDDSNLVKLDNISISSVAHPKELAGEKAARIILDCINNQSSAFKEDIIFTPEVILRDSVK